MLKTVSSITNAIGALNYKGAWNASTNTPAITSSVGVKGDYYVVSVSGSTTIDGISNWGVGDWIAYNGAVWQRVEGGADLNGVNLSVSGASTLSTLNTSGAVVFNDAGADVDFRVAGDTDANLLFVDAGNDRVGVGTNSPLVRLHVVTTGTGTNMGDNTIATFRSGASGRASTIQLSDGTNSNYVSSLSGALGFGSAGAELMRMTTGGDLLLGTTTKLAGGIDGLDINTAAETGITFAQSGTVKNYFYLQGGGAGTAWQWQTVAGIVVNIVSSTNGVTLANGGTSWGSLSDERKKDIIEPIENAAIKVSSIRAVIGKYKTEEDGIRRSMLIAQDVQAVLPEAVVENHDGDLILQYTDIIPLLVAAIKEQSVELEFLKTEITKLKGV